MPNLTYKIDKNKMLLTIEAKSLLVGSEVEDILKIIYSDKDYINGMNGYLDLVDVMAISISDEAVKNIVKIEEDKDEDVEGGRIPFKTAVVVGSRRTEEQVRSYGLLRNSAIETVEVFYDRKKALKWLGQ